MGSRVSSETPRPAKLPVVGTTWVRRGFPYWARRVSLGLFLFVVLGGLSAGIISGFFDLVGGLDPVWRAVCRVLYCLACAAGAVWGWIAARRRLRAAQTSPPTPEGARRLDSSGQSKAPGLALAGRLPALLLMPFLAPLLLWALFALLGGSLVRVLPVEISARRALEARSA
jgi:MFS family permease